LKQPGVKKAPTLPRLEALFLNKHNRKDMSKNQKNQYREDAKQIYLDMERERILNKKQNASFLERNYKVKNFLTYFILPIAIAYSLFTGFTFLYTHFIASFQNAAAAVFVSTVLVVGIEAGFYWMAKEALEDIADGSYRDGNHYTVAFMIKAAGVILFGGCSLLFSLKGSPAVAEFYTRKNDPIVLVDKKEINARYDAQVVEANKSQEKASTMTWRGKIVEDGRNLYNTAEDLKIEIEKNRSQELADAKKENEERTTLYESKITNSGHWFLGFAGGGQAVSLLILIFILVYEHGVAIEEKSQQSKNPDGQPDPLQNKPSYQPPGFHQIPTAAPNSELFPIQFSYPGQGKKKPPVSDQESMDNMDGQDKSNGMDNMDGQHVNGQVEIEDKTLSRQAKQSKDKDRGQVNNGSFPESKNEHGQVGYDALDKLDGQVKRGRVFFLNSKRVFEHVKEDGEKAFYTIGQVRGNRNKYQKRVEESQQKLEKAEKEGKDRMITIHKNALKNRTRDLEYWSEAYALFEE